MRDRGVSVRAPRLGGSAGAGRARVESSPRRGAASTALVVVVVLVLVAGVAALVWRGSSRGPEGLPAPASDAPHATSSGVGATTAGSERSASSPNATATTTPAPANDANRFEGRGRIRGELTPTPGVARPASWTLEVEPHPNWIGRERAARRSIVVEDGATFTVEDLPLAAYRLRARANGLNGSSIDVLLVRGSTDVFVQLELRPAGLIDGSAFALDGAPAEDLDVVLEDTTTHVRTTTRVTAAGTFAFRDVVDGDYTLTFGPPEAPLAPPRTITFVAPTLRVPKFELPSTGAIRVRAVDARGQPVSDVIVDGFGAPRGFLRVTTGFDGKGLARWLPAGRYRLEARAPDGRTGKLTIDVDAGPETEAIVQLRER